MDDMKKIDMSDGNSSHYSNPPINHEDISSNLCIECCHSQSKEALNENQKLNENDIDEKNIGIIRGQTGYDDETIRRKLALHNNDMMAVIREYMKPTHNTLLPKPHISTNQRIYNEIRNYMDDINEGYERRKSNTTQ